MKLKKFILLLCSIYIFTTMCFGADASLNDGLKKIASEMASEFKSSSNVIIVSSFLKVSGEENELGNIISEELITALYKTKKF